MLWNKARRPITSPASSKPASHSPRHVKHGLRKSESDLAKQYGFELFFAGRDQLIDDRIGIAAAERLRLALQFHREQHAFLVRAVDLFVALRFAIGQIR